jgi:hypothetical protein
MAGVCERDKQIWWVLTYFISGIQYSYPMVDQNFEWLRSPRYVKLQST